MKRLIGCILAGAMMLGLAACGGDDSGAAADGGESGGEGQVYNLRASTYLNTSDTLYPLLEEYCANVAEQTNGGVNITIYPGEQLGGYSQTFDETIRGTIEFGFNAVPGTYDNRVETTFIPGAYSTYDTLLKFAAPGSTVYNAYEDALAGQGVTMLGFFISGYNNLALNCDLPEGYVDPSVEKDVVVRVPDTAIIFDQIVSAMGYRTAALSGVDTYSGLQTGVVEGTIGQPNSMLLSSYSDVITNIIDTQLIASIDSIFINSEVFNSMPAEYQQVLRDCAAQLFEDNIQLLIDQDAVIEEELAEKGITVTHITDEERETLVNLMKETIWPELEEKFGSEFMESMQADIAG